jgi:hypothetical protein
MPPDASQPYVASGRPDMSPGADQRGWHEPIPHTPPKPTFWPAVLALAIALGMWSIMLDYLVIGAAVILFGIAFAGWIGDLLHD